MTQLASSPRALRHVLRELLLVATMFAAYQAGRALASGQRERAFENARLLRQFEKAVHLPAEASLQELFAHPAIYHLANVYYVLMHFPVALAFLAWGFWRRPPSEYRWARNLMAVQTAAALVIHVLVPMAPPRMFPQWGFVDTMSTYGPSVYDGAGGEVSNQLAAMPSLHIGWAVLVAYVVSRTTRRRGIWLAALCWVHATATVVVVVITGNHWWIDGAASVALLAGASIVIGRVAVLRRRSATRRRPGRYSRARRSRRRRDRVTKQDANDR